MSVVLVAMSGFPLAAGLSLAVPINVAGLLKWRAELRLWQLGDDRAEPTGGIVTSTDTSAPTLKSRGPVGDH